MYKFLAFIIALLPLHLYAQITPEVEPYMLEVQRAAAGTHSAVYDVSARYKKLMRADTNNYVGRCRLVHAPNDTLLGYYARLEFEFNGKAVEYVYTGDTLFWIYHFNKKAHAYDPVIRGVRSSTSSEILNLIVDNVFKGVEIQLTAETEQFGALKAGPDQVSPSLLRFDWTYHEPENQLIPIVHSTTWFDDKSGSPLKKESFHIFQLDTSYVSWEVSNLRRNVPGLIDSIRNVNIPADYEMAYSFEAKTAQKPREVTPLLAAGSQAPQFSGESINGTTINVDFKAAKLTLLDFWYSTCGPCLLALPSLQEMHQDYGKRGLQIVGVNSLESRSKGFTRLEQVIAKSGLTYPTLMVERAVDADYHVTGYPTTYLVDEAGRIVLSESGYSAEAMLEIRETIEAHLAED